MRVTSNSSYIGFGNNVSRVQEEKYRAEIQVSTGQRLITMADDPEAMIDIKKLTNRMSENDQYIRVNEKAIGELYAVDESITAISDHLNSIRDLAVDGSKTGNLGNLQTLGIYIRGLLDDIVKEANAEFNGNYLFSGNKTTPESLDRTPPAENNMPFEIVEGEPTEDNPSGLSVVFKGNFKERMINKDVQTQEQVNTTPDKLFGSSGTEMFDSIINLYNLFAYNDQGQLREKDDTFNKSDIGMLNQYQREVAEYNEKIIDLGGRNGSKINRIEQGVLLLKEENTRLNAFKSESNDTDIAEATINLKKNEIALQYALQIGAKISQNTLFDFLR